MAIRDLWLEWERKVERARAAGRPCPNKRPLKRWMADTYLCGRRVFKAFVKKEDAESWIAFQKRAELDRELGIKRKPRIGFRALARKFLSEKEGQRSKLTFKFYLNQIRPFLAPFFDDTPVDEISRERIGEYVAMRLARFHRGVPIHPRTVNKEVATLRRLFKFAQENGYLISDDPTRNIRPIKAQAKKTIRFLSDEELDRFLKVCGGKTFTFFLLVAETGMRRNEAWHCRWEWIDWERKVIQVTQGRGFRTKSHENRVIPMTARLHAHLQSLPGPRDGLLVPGRKNHRGKSGDVLFTCAVRQLAALALTAKVAPFTTHDLRHTYASRLVKERVSLYEVAKLLGHRDVKTTQIYAHFAPDFLKGAVALLDKRRSRRKMSQASTPRKASCSGDAVTPVAGARDSMPVESPAACAEVCEPH